MATCKRCGVDFDWGQTPQGRWVPLESVATDSDLPKSYVDTNGVLRADHRERCGGMPIQVAQLKKKVQPEKVPETKKKKSLKTRLKDAVPAI